MTDWKCPRCRRYESCGGPRYGCYPSFPEGDGGSADPQEDTKEDYDEDREQKP